MGIRLLQGAWLFQRPFGGMYQGQQGQRKDGALHPFLGQEETFPFAPKFKDCAKHPHTDEPGYVLYYTSQCPFNGKYVPVLETLSKDEGVPFKAIHLQSKEEAQNAPTPITTYAFFCNGEYVTNEQMNDKRFLKVIGK